MSAEPRFYVQKFHGYKIADRPAGNASPKTSFYVMDRDYLHRVVATFENDWPRIATTHAILLRRAERACDRLNEWDKALSDAE